MSSTATLEEIAELRRLCTDYGLDGRQILDGYLNSDRYLATMQKARIFDYCLSEMEISNMVASGL